MSENIARPEIGVDFGRSSDIQVIQCVCGFECDTVDEIVAHLKDHGAQVVTVRPEAPGAAARARMQRAFRRVR